ncbi:hypothetical protein E2C01_072074 [Portunus trituberculatus]|uniref:Uncharacterized protein n=1 Tax=Portunus trituberculatus TaxID=210409 RepID=A0A5B7I6T7_PORTR|nr:hypothetical protein [Portunus trituberculatus]
MTLGATHDLSKPLETTRDWKLFLYRLQHWRALEQWQTATLLTSVQRAGFKYVYHGVSSKHVLSFRR